MLIEEICEVELGDILVFLAGHQAGDHPTVLVGGWAVYAYNPYLKSTDIDLVLSSRRRSTLTSWLRERGYQQVRAQIEGWRGARKSFGSRLTMVVDIAGYSEAHKFEGREDRLDFSLVKGHSVSHQVAGSKVLIPTQSLLLLYKAKAAYDRNQRLMNGTSPDVERDEWKLMKDRSDILALIDRVPVTPDWEVGFLGEELARCDFLFDVLQQAPRDEVAVAKYSKLTQEEALEAVETFLSLVS